MYFSGAGIGMGTDTGTDSSSDTGEGNGDAIHLSAAHAVMSVEEAAHAFEVSAELARTGP